MIVDTRIEKAYETRKEKHEDFEIVAKVIELKHFHHVLIAKKLTILKRDVGGCLM